MGELYPKTGSKKQNPSKEKRRKKMSEHSAWNSAEYRIPVSSLDTSVAFDCEAKRAEGEGFPGVAERQSKTALHIRNAMQVFQDHCPEGMRVEFELVFSYVPAVNPHLLDYVRKEQHVTKITTRARDTLEILSEDSTIECSPFDNSGHFECKANGGVMPRKAVHKWTHPTSGMVGYFCPAHSPFDYVKPTEQHPWNTHGLNKGE